MRLWRDHTVCTFLMTPEMDTQHIREIPFALIQYAGHWINKIPIYQTTISLSLCRSFSLSIIQLKVYSSPVVKRRRRERERERKEKNVGSMFSQMAPVAHICFPFAFHMETYSRATSDIKWHKNQQTKWQMDNIVDLMLKKCSSFKAIYRCLWLKNYF